MVRDVGPEFKPQYHKKKKKKKNLAVQESCIVKILWMYTVYYEQVHLLHCIPLVLPPP
jgi:hypothetical protein